MKTNCNVWRFGTASFESILKAGLPTRISPCVNVCLFTLAFLYLCVCSALSPGTSAMPPLSQFLTSLLKNMLIQKKPSSSSSSPLIPQVPLGMDLEETRSSPTARVFDFALPLFFLTLFYYSKSSLPPRLTSTRDDEENLSIGNNWSVPFSRVSLLRGKYMLPAEIVSISKRGGGHQKKSHVSTPSISRAAGAAEADSLSNDVKVSRYWIVYCCFKWLSMVPRWLQRGLFFLYGQKKILKGNSGTTNSALLLYP